MKLQENGIGYIGAKAEHLQLLWELKNWQIPQIFVKLSRLGTNFYVKLRMLQKQSHIRTATSYRPKVYGFAQVRVHCMMNKKKAGQAKFRRPDAVRV